MRTLRFAGLAIALLFASNSYAQITVENSESIGFGLLGAGTQVMQDTYTIPGFDMGAGDKLVVAFATEAGTPASFAVDFGGAALTQISFATDSTGGERATVFFLDGASGVADVNVTLSAPGETQSNGPGLYVASLSGAQPGFEASGTFCDGQNHFNGDETTTPPRTTIETISGTSDGAYVIAAYGDQGHPAPIDVFGAQFTEVGTFLGDNGNIIGSAIAAIAEGFGTGADLEIGFNDGSPLTTPIENTFQARSVIAWGSFAAIPVDNGPVPPADFTVFRGVQLSGAVSDFASSDDTRASYNPGFVLNDTEAPVWLIFDANAPNATSFFVESQAGTPGLTYTMEAFDFTGQAFVVVDTQAESFNVDVVTTFPVAAANIDTDGSVRSRVGWRQTGFIINFPWVVSVDHVGWNQ